jgi:hypothetical protein
VKTYLLRDVPADLWRRVKAKAAMKDESIRHVILRLLQKYADG